MKCMKKWMLGLLLASALCLAVGCGNNGNDSGAQKNGAAAEEESGTGGLSSDGVDSEEDRGDNLVEDAGEGIEELGQGVKDLGTDEEGRSQTDADS